MRHFIYLSEFKPISKRQFEISVVMRILNIRHVISRTYYLFVVGWPFQCIIYNTYTQERPQ
jgi:hypothetical protein